MHKELKVTIENKLITERRDMNVYHHATRSAHIISHNSSVTLPLMPVLEEDYLHISIVSGPGNLEHKSLVNLPSWADFELSTEGKLKLKHTDGRTLLNVSEGPPTWELRITRSSTAQVKRPSDRITIADERQGYF